ncbi:MAG: DUF4038 domain-containing protein [Verrucomicrobia bacterium]|nr:DUF4038 domain-containing protein [Verrucomicrobiota bacterium]
MPIRRGQQHRVIEWSFKSDKTYGDAFNDLELDIVFADPGGREQRVPAFWAGGKVWKVRYAPHTTGRFAYRSVCSDASDSGLHDRRGTLEVAPYTGDNPLSKHGPIRVAADQRHFEHADGTPFFWLGDTWWMGLCTRLKWPKDFRLLTADRVAKGFTVVQIVAGLYPDMPEFDPRGANEAGFPWNKEKTRINPPYFDKADLRIQHLVEQGLVPCVVGCWGYHLPMVGEATMKKHWRNLVARWGAYPVVWCLAGEGSMPYYLSETKEQDTARQKRGWTELGRYVRGIDPFRRLVSIHPSANSRDTVEDPAVLDFDMLQTGHGDRTSLPNTVRQVTGSLKREPKMPVINSEVCYGGILEASREEVQRLMFWTCVLSGATGHTYGANGIWQVNTEREPFGPSPHGRSWGDTPWTKAYQLPGSTQLGLAKRFLMRYEWWRFEPHPEWAEPHWTEQNFTAPYAAGIPGKVRMVFAPTSWNLPKLTKLEPDVSHRAFLWNPSTGKETELGRIKADANGTWQPPVPPIVRDWVIVLEKVHVE